MKMGISFLLAAEANLNIFDPVSPPAEFIRNLFLLVLAVTGGIFLIVEGVLLYSIVCFRRQPAAGSNEPPQVYGSKPIEIAWTAAPAMIVFILILVVARTEWEVRADPARPPPGSQPLYVTVIGHQWWWEYHYQNYDGKELGFITANELHVPAGQEGVPRPVYLTLKSADVCHSFAVPRLAGRTDLIPGRTNQMWFQTDRPGLYHGQCTEFCGTQHATMLLRVYVDPVEDFERWAAQQQKPAVEDAAARAGKDVFLANSCINCHRVRGTRAKGTVGPDLTHLMSRKTIGSNLIENTPVNLRAWIVDPQKLRPGCLMPAFSLSDHDFDLLTRYLLTLR
jgi:cytochrome c oxidase subunit 2